MLTRLYCLLLIFLAAGMVTQAQVTKKYRFVNGRWVEEKVTPKAAAAENDDEEWADYYTMAVDSVGGRKIAVDTMVDVSNRLLPTPLYLPMVFDTYNVAYIGDTVRIAPPAVTLDNTLYGSDVADEYGDTDLSQPLEWVNDRSAAMQRYLQFRQRYMIDNIADVKYNINTLPEAPKRFHAFVDPATARITVEEIKVDKQDVKNTVDALEVEKMHWLRQFDGLVQFSQAYNSPNWYQGGNNNLNAILQGIYNVRLNQKFHPNLLFENTVQYKLGLNSAPDDSLRNYSISEDNFQVNSKFGVKAAKRWYYSATLQFKTQLLNNYRKNTNDLSASFLSPGELNIGLGLTYDYSTPSGNFKTNASIAPLSYNLKICTNDKIDETQFGIKEGHTTVSQYGSNIDCKLEWNIAYNISFNSHLTAFTDYSYIQGDWENTLSFSINRFLSTQIYVHLRYDSTTGRYDDTKWHKWQLREVLSFGFAYKLGQL